MMPPSEGPSAAENAPIAPQIATTCGSFSRGNAAKTRASDEGTRTAAPTPWSTRAKIRSSIDPASPQTIDASVKITEPI